MSSILQIKTFIYSFIFGISFYYLVRINNFMIRNISSFWQFVFNLIFIIDSVLVYIFFNYRLNNGYFHFYFLIVMVIGFVLADKLINKICKKCVNRFKKSKIK